MNGEIESGCRMLYRMQEVFSAVAQEPMSPKTPVTQSKRDFVHQALAIELSPIASKLVFSGPPPDAPTIPSLQGHKQECVLDYGFIAERLKIDSVRPLQRDALNILMGAAVVDTKIIQAPTSMGKDLLPFALAVATKKAQLMFVPFKALIENTLNEGATFGCKVITFSDIGKTITIATAAATADVIVCSYEHAERAVRITQELLTRQRLGWLFLNEVHVIQLDGDYRDFGSIHEICAQCPQICCMTATLQHQYVSSLAAKLGRTGFSKSMFIPPTRPKLAMMMKITSDSRLWIAQQLVAQPADQRAIVFCLFKKSVPEVAKYLQGHVGERKIFECISGATADIPSFRADKSAIMICTTVLCAGISVGAITRIFFLDCAHGPEAFVQGAGRGARAEHESCVAALVTTKKDILYYTQSGFAGIAEMAALCQECLENNLEFSHEVCKLFEHPGLSEAKKRQHDHEEVRATLVYVVWLLSSGDAVMSTTSIDL
jgi:superfamily II DNA helicase RecQ